MIAAPRRALPRVAITIASLSAVAFGEVLEFRAAFSSNPGQSEGEAAFLSVEARPGFGGNLPARAFAGGYFTGGFLLGRANPLFSQNAEDGVLAGLSRDALAGTWNVDWLLQAASEGGNARINDVAIARTGEVYVTGTFEGVVIFDGIVLNAPPVGPPAGFVAWADPSGKWIDAFEVPDLQPLSIALDVEGAIYLTGPPILARAYDPGGNELWTNPGPQGAFNTRHIAVETSGGPGNIYVNGEVRDAAQNQDVFVAELKPTDGDITWLTPVFGSGEERAGGLGVGPLGRLRVSFSSDASDDVQVGPDPLKELPNLRGRHSHLLFLSRNGDWIRDNLLGNSLEPGSSMDTSDLALDPAGNAYVAVSFFGVFEFEGVPRDGQNDAAVVSIDPRGTPIRFSASTGSPRALGNAVAAPGRNLQVLAGALEGTNAEQFDNLNVQARPEGNAFIAVLESAPGQDAFILVSPNNEPIDVMVQRITSLGGEVYRTIDRRNGDLRFVAAFLTDEQLQRISAFYLPFPDNPLVTDGTVSPSGYALEALNKAPASAPFSYQYPETCQPTVLYLIDTGVDNSSGYFNGNPNLTLGATIDVAGIGDPFVFPKVAHATEMLSMIAGPTYGVAQGTPITVVNYNIYPDGASARLSALVEAIGLANSHKALTYPYDPAVYCVASSATTPGNSTPTLESVVSYATSSAVYATVVVSAGNTKGLAEDYTPSDLGVLPGVICAGAINSANTQLAATRGGGGVDIWAPGDSVDAADPFGLATTVTGTSASTALTAGAALVYLSANPVATPAALETALVTTYAQSDTIGPIVHVPVGEAPGFSSFADWGAWYGLADASKKGNDDGDIWSNEEEFIWGLHPLVFDYPGSLVTVSYSRVDSALTFQFPLSCLVYQPSALSAPHALRNGSTLIIERSVDLHSWTDVTNSLTIVEAGSSGGQVTLSFEVAVKNPRCFYRVHVQ